MRRLPAVLLIISALYCLTAASERVVLVHDSLERFFDIHTPPSYDGSTGVPLVIDIHGYGGSANTQQNYSGFREKADEEGFIVVWPGGYQHSWNGGLACCGAAVRDSIDDVGFIRKIVEFMKLGYAIDTTRIYATGHSNGSAMAQRVANDASDIFAAVAGFALMLIAPPNPSQAIAVINFHGYDDYTIEYDGGVFQNDASYPSAQENFHTWAEVNNCTGTPVETTLVGSSKCETYITCDDNVEVTLCSIEAGHMIYSNYHNIDLTTMAWNFMKQFTLKGRVTHLNTPHSQAGKRSPRCYWDRREASLVIRGIPPGIHLKIYDCKGREISLPEQGKLTRKIALPEIAPGTYLVKTGMGNLINKFLKQ
ncbi:MAG: hypothetical protein GF401_03200 [Chitinivibrionales bacterium]|nr:hypothetical protein [Chitinivibrionales bacterium]